MADLGRSRAELAPPAPFLFWGVLAACAVVLAVGSIVLALTAAERQPQRVTIRAPQPSAVPAQNLAAAEIGRLGETVRTLATDRDKIVARVETLERSMGDVTASISRERPAPVQPPAPTAEEPLPPASRTEFAVDLGGEVSIEGLRALWASMRGMHAGLQGLRPLISVRDGEKPGTVELRLVAGPFVNAAAAARLCAALAAKRAVCSTTAFEGQRLSLR
jgi:hypothetical protein